MLVASLVVPSATTYFALMILGFRVVPRFFSYLLFHLLFLVALGIIEVAGQLARITRSQIPVTMVLLLISGYGLERLVALTQTWNRLPIENYREAAVVAKSTGSGRVLTDSRFAAGFIYYFGANGIEFSTPDILARVSCESREPLTVIDYPLYTNGADLSCLASRGATRIDIPQRAGGPEGGMRVWILRSSSATEKSAEPPKG